MKKLILSMTMVAAFAAVADDATTYQALYWQVTADSLGGYSGATYANLFATLDGDVVSVPSSPLEASGFVELNRTAGGLDDGLNRWAVNLSGWNGGSSLDGAMFFVELFNESRVVAQSEGISYADLKSFIDMNYSGSGIPATATGAAVFSVYSDIPEPTSGLLALLGIAGLALRRKRV